MHYRPEIDGLRCLAVLPVIVFHAERTWAPGGFLGVDVFFVISGFLITSIILRETENNSFSFARFWSRRVKRILPAASAVLLATSLIHAAFFFRPDAQAHRGEKLAAIFSVANVYYWLNTGDYWGQAAEDSPYLHFWSLSVEEQYYLFYPPLLVGLLAASRRAAFPVVVGAAVVSFGCFAYGLRPSPSATFYLLPTRAWELGLGCLLAMTPGDRLPRGSSIGALVGVGLIVLMYLFGGGGGGIGLSAFVTVVGACLVIASGSSSAADRLLANPLAVWIGKLSYSLYLWHWPVLVSIGWWASYDESIGKPTLLLVGAALVAVLSVLSYLLIESPLRRMRHGAPITLAGVAALVGYFAWIEPTWLAKPYAAEEDWARTVWHGVYYDVSPRGKLSDSFESIIATIDTPRRADASPEDYRSGGVVHLRSGETAPRIVLLGDSHGVMWAKAVDDVGARLGVSTALWALNGEDPMLSAPDLRIPPSQLLTPTEDRRYDESRRRLLTEWRPDVVALATRWHRASLDRTLPTLRFLSQTAGQVLLIESPPRLARVENRNFGEFAAFLRLRPDSQGDLLWPGNHLADTEKARSTLVELASLFPNVSFVPTADLFLEPDGVLAIHERAVLYLDDDHVTDAGAALVQRRFADAIESLLKGETDAPPLIRGDDAASAQNLEAATLRVRSTTPESPQASRYGPS